jgi:transcriptional regulator with XRE-family HTH domain
MEPDGPESTKAIGQRLRWTRLALNFRYQADIARKISDDPNFAQVWNNWEKGRDRISVDNAIMLVRKFRLSLDWIFLGDDARLARELSDRIAEIRKADPPPAKKRPRAAQARP